MAATHGIIFQGNRFWVTHRRRRYGPFDYEWSKDFAGIELMFDGQKFGEYCGQEEIFADLKEFRLPAAVVGTATIVMGCVVYSILNGLREPERIRLFVQRLTEGGFETLRPVPGRTRVIGSRPAFAGTRLNAAKIPSNSRFTDC